jgi:hypothetical protein|tara:strand:+ start:324 stop:584 length:261 start_codon:yes stop_codon:yes gene_type:complete
MNRLLILLFASSIIIGCSPSAPQITFASENTIEIKYSAYDYGPTVTAEAIDIAIKHCAKYNKGMRLISSNAASPYSTEEIHTFMCE